jgi:hypothetical protein
MIGYQEVWRCSTFKGVIEKNVRLVMVMYEGATTQVRTSIGLTDRFNVKSIPLCFDNGCIGP